MPFREMIIALIFVLWLTANICYLLMNKRRGDFTHRSDLFRWLSTVQFFLRSETFYLSYRDMLANQSLSPWQSVSLNQPWRIYHAIWFPRRTIDEYVKSMLSDLAHYSRKDKSGLGRKKIKERFIYHALFYFLQRYPKNDDGLGRQFRIQDEENKEVYISDFYRE